MKNRLLILSLILCLLMTLTLPVFASPYYLIDDAGLLSSSEAARVEAELSRVSAEYGMDIVIVTVESTGGKTPTAYADDYYDYNGYAPDGILLLVSMEDRDCCISTTGEGYTVITDADVEYIFDQIVPYVSDGEYAQAFMEFAGLCEEFIVQATTFNFGTNLIIAVVIGLVAALIVTGVMKAQLKTVRQQARADAYIAPGGLELTNSRDIFLYSHISRREKPKQNSGSSTHVSSSGTRHGGGSRKF